MSLENYKQLSDKVNKEKSIIDKNKNGLDTKEANELSKKLMESIKTPITSQNAANITRIWDKVSSDIKKVKGLELQEKPKNNKESIELIQKLINGSCVDENGSKIQVTINSEMSNDTLAKIFIIQQSLGIKVDGVFGPETIQSIVKKCNGESEKVIVNETMAILSDVGVPTDIKSKLGELKILDTNKNTASRQTLDFSKYPGLSLIKKKDNSYVFSIDKSPEATKEINLNDKDAVNKVKGAFKPKEQAAKPKVEVADEASKNKTKEVVTDEASKNKTKEVVTDEASKNKTKEVVTDDTKPKIEKTKEEIEKEKIQDKLHDLGLTSGGGEFDTGRYEGLSLSIDGKKLVYINEKNETKEYDILSVTKEGRKHLKLDNTTTIEKGKTGLGKKLEKLVKKEDGTDRNLIKLGGNIGEIVADGLKKAGKGTEKLIEKAVEGSDKLVENIEADKEFDTNLKKFGLDLKIYKEITKDITSNLKEIDTKYQTKYIYEFSSANKKEITNRTIKKDGENIVIMATEGAVSKEKPIQHTITVNKDKKISIK